MRFYNFACRLNPRVIDDSAWLKLIWASLNIEQRDLLSEIHYPLAMIKAMAVVWTHAGLRRNEIGRLAVGCARSQNDDILNDDGSRVPAGTRLLPGCTRRQDFSGFREALGCDSQRSNRRVGKPTTDRSSDLV